MNRHLKTTQMLVMLMALLLAACGKSVESEPMGIRSFGAQEANVEGIRFRSGSFRMVGDLRMPVGEGPHPAIIMVHGDGAATRDGAVPFGPLIEIFLRNGYAVLSWDKPGSGESTGEFNRKGEWDVLTKRAEILADAVEVLAEHPSIDPDRIGLWGISQAGWVMPKTLELSERVAFMIVVSGGGEASSEQMAYLFGQKLACGGGTVNQAALVEQYWAQTRNATSYDEYREAMETLTEIPRFELYTGVNLSIEEEDEWQPFARDTDRFFDPVDVLEHTTIPVLAFFGQLDKNVDPVQGAAAYEVALQEAGNQDYQIVVIPGVAHTLTSAKTGCLNENWGTKLAPEYLETMEAWLQRLSQTVPTTAVLPPMPTVAPTPTPATAPTPTGHTELGSIDAAVDQQIQALMDAGDIPSLSVGIVVEDELVWAKNYGGPAGLDSVYVVGSIQKPFTASAVLQLVEQGSLDLDEDVSAYLPFPVRHPRYPDTPITIRLLLTHQSGLGAETGVEGVYIFQDDYSVYEFGEGLLGIEFPRLDPYPSCATFYEGLLTPGGVYYEPDVWEFKPGTVHYSNTGFQFLGCIVEQVSGQPLAEYIEEHVLDPLGMAHSGYSVSALVQYHALPHERVEGGYLYMDGENVPIREEHVGLVKNNLLQLPLYEWTPGAGGLRTTVPDLARFLIAHMDQGLATNGFQLLQPETLEMMHQVAGSDRGNINSFGLVGQGMGWTLCQDGVEGHVGGQIGYGGTMILKKAENGTVGILVMTNVSAMYLENDRRGAWFGSYYGEIERLLLQTAEEMLAKTSSGFSWAWPQQDKACHGYSV